MKKTKQAGQSTIEFIFTFAFGVSIIFLIFTSALNHVTGYLVHYATFMASRTYLTGDYQIGTVAAPQASLTGTAELANEVFKKYMLQIFNVTDFKINQADNNPSYYLTTGGATLFDLKMDVVGQITGQKKLELVSESFLGKEPTRAQCANRTCFGITGNSNCNNQMDITLYDNGC
jgi:hypothetical protein